MLAFLSFKMCLFDFFFPFRINVKIKKKELGIILTYIYLCDQPFLATLHSNGGLLHFFFITLLIHKDEKRVIECPAYALLLSKSECCFQ